MNELQKGILASFAIHMMILSPLAYNGGLFSSEPKKKTLDIGFSFHLKPLGNTRDRSAISTRKLTHKRTVREVSPQPEGQQNNVESSEKKYGDPDGTAGVDEFYVSENYNSIMGEISNQLLYPAIARKMGWEGKVLVAFLITPDGKIQDVSIKKGSGYSVLDNSAIKTIKSIRKIPLPETTVRVTLPISFRLK